MVRKFLPLVDSNFPPSPGAWDGTWHLLIWNVFGGIEIQAPPTKEVLYGVVQYHRKDRYTRVVFS